MGKCYSSYSYSKASILPIPEYVIKAANYRIKPVKLKRKYTVKSPHYYTAFPDKGWIFPCIRCESPTDGEVTSRLYPKIKVSCCKTCQNYLLDRKREVIPSDVKVMQMELALQVIYNKPIRIVKE